MGFQAQQTDLVGVGGTRVTVSRDDETLSYRDVVNLWIESKNFRTWFADFLREVPFGGYFWETPPVTQDTLNLSLIHI